MPSIAKLSFSDMGTVSNGQEVSSEDSYSIRRTGEIAGQFYDQTV